MRLGLMITSKSGKETFIFKLDDLGSTGSATSVKTVPRSLAVVSSISGGGTANYVDDPAKELGGYMAVAGEHENEYNPGASKLVSLEADEVATVSYYLYLEGSMSSARMRYRIRARKSSWHLPEWIRRVNRKGRGDRKAMRSGPGS